MSRQRAIAVERCDKPSNEAGLEGPERHGAVFLVIKADVDNAHAAYQTRSLAWDLNDFMASSNPLPCFPREIRELFTDLQ